MRLTLRFTLVLKGAPPNAKFRYESHDVEYNAFLRQHIIIRTQINDNWMFSWLRKRSRTNAYNEISFDDIDSTQVMDRKCVLQNNPAMHGWAF